MLNLNYSIQSLRGISVIAVVLFHAKNDIFPNGYLGVDLFFIISGFLLIPKIIEVKSIGGLRALIIKRFLRLWPALIFVGSLSFILVFFLAPTYNLRIILNQLLYSIIGFGNLSANNLKGDYFTPRNLNPFLHLWSLSTEIQIYLITILIYLYVLRKRFQQETKLKFLRLISLCLIISFLLDISIKLFTESTFNYYSPFSKLWLFLAGGLLSFSQNIVYRLPYLPIINPKIFLLVILLAPISLPSTLGQLLLIYVFILSFKTKRHRVLDWCGDKSYSIYLWHLPLLYLAKYSTLIGNTDRALFTFCAIVITFILAKYTQENIEYWYTKNTSFSSKHSDSKLSSFSIPFVLNLLILVITYNLILSGGVPRVNYLESVRFERLDCDPSSQMGCQLLSKDFNPAVTINLLVGDSTAVSLSDLFVDRIENSMVLAKNGCPILSMALTLPECTLFDQKVNQFISERKNINLYLSNNIETKNQLDVYTKNILNLSSSRKIYILGPAPKYDDNQIFYSNMFRNSPFFSKYNFPLRELDSLNKVENAQWNSVKNKNIIHFDLFKIFCSQKGCVKGNSAHWFYIDNTHLSVYGAKLVIERLIRVSYEFTTTNIDEKL